MYQNVHDFNPAEAETQQQRPQCRHEQQPSTSIDIPSSNNSRDLFYKQMSPQYQEFYNDILSFTSESSLLDAYPMDHASVHSNNSSARDQVDPMNDPQFMAFLSSLSTNEQPPTPSPHGPSSALLVPDLYHQQKEAEADTEDADESEPQGTTTRKQAKRIKVNKKRVSKSNTRLGQCEHPKHSLYRQEKYILSTHGVLPSDDVSSATSLQSLPRRGRPPKGSKSSEFVYSTSPIPAFAEDTTMVDAASSSSPAAQQPASSAIHVPCYPMVELTVRPLPKRLEAVVGRSNIKVCLTCLKRSDMDPAYLRDAAYVGPQTLAKRKK